MTRRGDVATLQAPHRLATRLQERFRTLEADFHRAYWDSQVSADADTEARRAELELELRRSKGDPEALRQVDLALAEPVHDPVLRRTLQVLRLSLAGNQMSDQQRDRIVELSSSIESDFAGFRAELDGLPVSDNDIEAILKASNDSGAREKAWLASKDVGAVVADRVRELARIRNEVARDLGFPDYFKMSLAIQELDEEWLFDVLDGLEQLTDEPFARWKAQLDSALRARFGADTILPWHYADPFFQQLPQDGRVGLDDVLDGARADELAVRTFAAWNVDLSGVMARSDLYPREGKSQHAFCLDVDRSGGDVRILANIVPGERWVEVMLHESGHAAYDVVIDPQLPYALHRPAHTFVTEAIAILSGRFVRDPDWLTGVAGRSSGEIDSVAPGLLRASAAHSLLFARWGLVMVHFERDLYSDPEADLDARWWELVERLQQVTPPPDRSRPDWAAKVHVATAPVYYQNYLLGELLASQLKTFCERTFGGFLNVAGAGEHIVNELCKQGAWLRWDHLVEVTTGRSLSADDFAASLLGGLEGRAT